MSTKERLEKHRDKKLDQCNEATRNFRDFMLLSEQECDELIEAINAKLLCEKGNKTATYLRAALSLAIDTMRAEDVLVKMNGWKV